MQDIYDEITNYLLGSITEENALFLLFEFMRQHIDFDRIVCFSIDRKKNILTNFIEYGRNVQSTNPYSVKLSYTLPSEEFKHHFQKNTDTILINNRLDREEANDTLSPLLKMCTEQMPFRLDNFVTCNLHYDKEKEIFFSYNIISEQELKFQDKQIQLIKILNKYIKSLTYSYFLNSSQTKLTLSPSGQFSTSYVEQLRKCPGLKNIMQQVEPLSKTDSTILILGPTGSGKELIADALYSLSNRNNKPFIKVNCGSLTETLMESELFGHERGAFTGAVQTRIGFFEQANKGTIYLDEIAELSKNAQVKLLRVLENKEIQRVGGTKYLSLDFRLIAATHKDLWEMVQKGDFRADLFYRLSVYPIHIPALNQRVHDIPVLAEFYYNYYVNKFKLSNPPQLSYENIHSLMSFPWPGNVRQLKHCIERSFLQSITTNSSTLNFDFILQKTKKTKNYPSKNSKEEILTALIATNGKIQGKNGAAFVLGLSPSTLRNRMRAYNIALPKQNI